MFVQSTFIRKKQFPTKLGKLKPPLQDLLGQDIQTQDAKEMNEVPCLRTVSVELRLGNGNSHSVEI